MELFAITDNTVGTRIVRIVTDRPTQNVVTQLFSEQKTFATQKVWNFQVDTSLVEMSFLSFLTLMMLSLY